MLLKLLLVMLVAMLPVIELRGAIPIAASMNLPEVCPWSFGKGFTI